MNFTNCHMTHKFCIKKCSLRSSKCGTHVASVYHLHCILATSLNNFNYKEFFKELLNKKVQSIQMEENVGFRYCQKNVASFESNARVLIEFTFMNNFSFLLFDLISIYTKEVSKKERCIQRPILRSWLV